MAMRALPALMKAPLEKSGGAFAVCAGLALLASLSACGEEAPAAPAPEPAATATIDPAAAARAQLVGTYRVLSIGGHAPALSHGEGAEVTIDEEKIGYRSQCIYGNWTWRIERGAIYTDRWHEEGSAMCARALEPDEVAIERVLDAVKGYRVLPEGNLAIEGPNATLELFRVDDTDVTAITAASALSNQYRVAGLDGQELGGTRGIAVVMSDTQVSFGSDCPGLTWAMTVERGGLIRITRSGSGAGAGCTAEHGEVAGALDAINRATRLESNAVELTGNGRSLILFTQ